jgi:hypothetical protein
MTLAVEHLGAESCPLEVVEQDLVAPECKCVTSVAILIPLVLTQRMMAATPVDFPESRMIHEQRAHELDRQGFQVLQPASDVSRHFLLFRE